MCLVKQYFGRLVQQVERTENLYADEYESEEKLCIYVTTN